jgi:hypothetical protein
MSTYENSVTCVTKAPARSLLTISLFASLVKRYATIGNAFAQVQQTRRTCAPLAYFVSVLAIDDAYVILGARSFRT